MRTGKKSLLGSEERHIRDMGQKCIHMTEQKGMLACCDWLVAHLVVAKQFLFTWQVNFLVASLKSSSNFEELLSENARFSAEEGGREKIGATVACNWDAEGGSGWSLFTLFWCWGEYASFIHGQVEGQAKRCWKMTVSVLSKGFSLDNFLEVPSNLNYNAMIVLTEADGHFATIQSFRRGMPQPAAQHTDTLLGVMPCNL